jgi:hypothetical protein
LPLDEDVYSFIEQYENLRVVFLSIKFIQKQKMEKKIKKKEMLKKYLNFFKRFKKNKKASWH